MKTMDDFIKAYGTRTIGLMVDKLIDERNDELAITLRVAMVDLQEALEDYVETAVIPHD